MIETPERSVHRTVSRSARTRSRVRRDLAESPLERAAFAWIAIAPWVAILGIALGLAPAAHGQVPNGVAAAAPAGPNGAGTGELHFRTEGGTVPARVLDVEVEVEVRGIVAHGTLRQRFRNPTDGVLDADYVFPVPERGSVRRVDMTIGERRILSEIREKAEARETFLRAREDGKTAALVESFRPNLFRTRVANVPPGVDVEVTLEYVHEVDYEDGESSVVVPLAYTPRAPGTSGPTASPSGTPTERDGAASPARSVPGRAPEADVVVRIDAGVPLAEVTSPSHDVTTFLGGEFVEVRPASGAVPADRDFAVRFSWLVPETIATAARVEEREDGRYVLAMIVPPADDTPRGFGTETVFVIDVSGSMAGDALNRAREALAGAVARLEPGDRFEIVSFADDVQAFADGIVDADPAIVRRAIAWVEGLHVRGGTRIAPALDRAFATLQADAANAVGRSRRIVLITDGAVADEAAHLRTIATDLGDVRLHTLGLGPAPNRWFVREMARLGRGVSAFVHDLDDADDRIDRFLRRVARPVARDVRIDGLPLDADPFPSVLPDLHVGEPLYVSFRLPAGSELPDVRVTARASDGAAIDLPVALDVVATPGRGIATRWARARIDALLDGLHHGDDESVVRDRVVEVALAHAIATRYTSFVAVEHVPSTRLDPTRVDVANGRVGRVLPATGTSRPLVRRLAGVALALAAALVALGRRTWA